MVSCLTLRSHKTKISQTETVRYNGTCYHYYYRTHTSRCEDLIVVTSTFIIQSHDFLDRLRILIFSGDMHAHRVPRCRVFLERVACYVVVVVVMGVLGPKQTGLITPDVVKPNEEPYRTARFYQQTAL